MSKTGARQDPVPGFRFTITFDDLPPGGFTDCTGLQMESAAFEYAEGGLNTHTWRFPGRWKQMNLTLKRGIVNRVLYDWYLAVAEGDFKARNATVLVHDPSGSEDLIEFRLQEAFPVKWAGPDLAAGQNNLAVESMELAHQGLERTK
jgi:phage tail-like protein